MSCPPLCALVVTSFAFFCHGLPLYMVPVRASDVCDGVIEGLGWCACVWEVGGSFMRFGVAQARLPE